MIAVASLKRPSVLTVLQGMQPGNVGLRAFDNATHTRPNYIPTIVLADKVKHIWRGKSLYLCLTNEDSVRVYRVSTQEENLLNTQAIEIPLPQTIDVNATRMQQAVTWVDAAGDTYLLLTGRDDDVALLQLDGPGALSGTTVVSVSQGAAQFTDLALDLIGKYELSFRAISLDVVHESYGSYAAAGQAMNITVGLGEASQLALSYATREGFFPAVVAQDQGGNLLSSDAVEQLQIMVVATWDIPTKYSRMYRRASYNIPYPAHVHHFSVGSSHFVAIANSFNGVKYATDSKIMQMTSDGNLVVFQNIQTKCAYRFSSFGVTSHNVTSVTSSPNNVTSTPNNVAEASATVTHYLAVANHFDDVSDRSYATSSVIYKMNPIGTFVVFQEIPTLGATKLQHFTISGVQFIAIANFFDGSFHSVDSSIWKWDAKGARFLWFQNIATVGAHDVEYLSAYGQHFLIIAQYRSADEVGYASSSLLLQYRDSAERFELISEVKSAGARDIEVFEIQGVSYFAVANYASAQDGSKQTQSFIYRLECSAGNGQVADVDGSSSAHNRYNARLFQEFSTAGASSWTHFERSGLHYLAVTNLDDAHEHTLRIYAWNITGNVTGFDLYTVVTTEGQPVMASDFFTAAGLFYGIVSLPEESTVELYEFVSSSGDGPTLLSPALLGAEGSGQAIFEKPYSLEDAFYFRTQPEGQLTGVSSGPVRSTGAQT
jgi:hypothetical protein